MFPIYEVDMTYKQTQQGYSLIELVIYIALFTMISIILVRSLLEVMSTYATAQGYRRLQNNGELIMERITREVRDASDITASSILGTNPGTLALTGTDSDENDTAVTFSVSNNAVQINDNGDVGNLSTSEVAVTSLIFRSITTAVGEGVKVELTLTTTNGYIVSSSFYSTIMIRDN
jgi:Tfp pilus assembly protein PilW